MISMELVKLLLESHIFYRRVNETVHLSHPPFDNVAKMLIIHIVILFTNRPLSAVLQFILSVAEGLSEKGIE